MSRRDVAGSWCWAVAFVAAMQVGRSLRLPDESMSVVWPACGVASLWLLGRRGPVVALDMTLMTVATVVVNLLTDAPVAVALWFVPVHLAQALVGAWMLQRLVPGLWGCDGRLTFDTIGRFSRLLAVAASSSLLAALVAAAAQGWLLEPATPLDVAGHWGRNTFGFLGVVAVVHLCGHAWRFRDPEHPLVPRQRWAELGLLTAATIAVYAAVFGAQATLPLAFVPGAVSIWAGLRFAPAVVSVLTTGAAMLAFGGTMAGAGPFALVPDLPARGLLVQVLMTISVATGLSLAAVRAESHRLMREASDGRDASDASAYLLATIVDTMEPGLVVLNAGGTPLRRNRPAARLLEMRPATDGAGGVSHETWETVWRHVAEQADPGPLDLRLDDADGSIVVEVRPAPMRDPDLGRTGTVVILTDVTEERTARDQLVGFSSTVAHDLRGPLTSMKGWAHALADELDGDESDLDLASTMAHRVITSALRMEDLIGDLLTHAVSRDGALDPGSLSLDRLALEVAESFGAPGRVVVHGPVEVLADAGLMRHLLTNLVGNALKYVAPGTVPRVEMDATSDGEHVEVRLRDNGIGIPAEHRGKVFEQFHRVRTDYPGTGLGLAICRTIVERHGGSIRVDAEPSGGSCFVFTLPAPLRTRPHDQPAALTRR